MSSARKQQHRAASASGPFAGLDRARLLPILAICSLILLAVLQFRWLSQVGEAQRQNLTRNLERELDRLAETLDRELSRAYTFYMVGVFESVEREALLAERDRLWHDQAPYPRLVRAVYLVNPRLRTEPRRLGADGRFETQAWTSELDPLRELLDGRGEPPTNGPRFLIAEIPALVTPPANTLARRGPPGGFPRRPFPPERPPHLADQPVPQDPANQPPPQAAVAVPDAIDELIVVVLDQSYLVENLIPQLMAEQLALDPNLRLAYRLERAGPRPQLLAADGALGAHDPQVQRPLLRLRNFADLGQLRRGAPSAKEAAWRASDQFPAIEDQARHLTHMALEGGAPGLWNLAVGYRGDSLEHLVLHTRLKNLAISLAILSLLALSLILIQRNSARERDLASRQLEFVAGISHELLTPLAGIRSAGQNLSAGVVTDKAKVATYGQVIEKECDRLTELVQQVLTYAGLGGRSMGERSWQPVAELVREGLADCRDLLERHGFRCETHLAENCGYVLADRLALRRVLQNLVGNAVKYAAAGAWVRVGLERQGGEVVLSVRDRGPGIDPADLAHLFEPFFRGHRQVAGTTPGSGLGLYIVKHIVADHGGQVSVGRGTEGGAEFTLRLPARQRPPTTPSEATP